MGLTAHQRRGKSFFCRCYPAGVVQFHSSFLSARPGCDLLAAEWAASRTDALRALERHDRRAATWSS
jgi:hypothetical protein